MSRQEPVWVSVVNLVTGTKGPPGGETGTITPSKGQTELRRNGTPGSGPSHSGGQRVYATPGRKPPNTAPVMHSGDIGHLLCTPTSTGGGPSGLSDLHVCESPASTASAQSQLYSRRSLPGLEVSNAPSQELGRPAWLASKMQSEADAASSEAIRRRSAEAEGPAVTSGCPPGAGDVNQKALNSGAKTDESEKNILLTRESAEETAEAASVSEPQVGALCRANDDCSTSSLPHEGHAVTSLSTTLSNSDGASQPQALDSVSLSSKPAATLSTGSRGHSPAPSRRASLLAESEAVTVADKVVTIKTDSSDDEVVVLGLAEPSTPPNADAVRIGGVIAIESSNQHRSQASDAPDEPCKSNSGNFSSQHRTEVMDNPSELPAPLGPALDAPSTSEGEPTKAKAAATPIGLSFSTSSSFSLLQPDALASVRDVQTSVRASSRLEFADSSISASADRRGSPFPTLINGSHDRGG
eukprot:jgi/Botrbrau1/1481/Bobra.178_3s0037.1